MKCSFPFLDIFCWMDLGIGNLFAMPHRSIFAFDDGKYYHFKSHGCIKMVE